jgi:hypothetical protein
LVDFILDSVIIYKKEDKMKVLLSIIIITTIFTGCMTNSLSNTCKKFGMVTDHVLVYAVDSDELGASKTVTQFKCVPKKYKDR